MIARSELGARYKEQDKRYKEQDTRDTVYKIQGARSLEQVNSRGRGQE